MTSGRRRSVLVFEIPVEFVLDLGEGRVHVVKGMPMAGFLFGQPTYRSDRTWGGDSFFSFQTRKKPIDQLPICFLQFPVRGIDRLLVSVSLVSRLFNFLVARHVHALAVKSH